MPNFKVITLMLGSVVAVSTAAGGQTTTNAKPAPPQRSSYRRTTLDEQVRRFAKGLDLDASQQAALKSVLEHQQARATQLRLDQSVSGPERISRLRALQEDTVLQIRALLNEEQKKKYDPQNHAAQTNSSDSYVNDWLKAPQKH
jgi:hypothetical protein